MFMIHIDPREKSLSPIRCVPHTQTLSLTEEKIVCERDRESEGDGKDVEQYAALDADRSPALP